MNATSATRALLDGCPDALVVAALGTAVSALREASDDGPHLYMGGAMGSALGVALGVADRRPDRQVLAILGDGETLMGAARSGASRRCGPRTCWSRSSPTAATRSRAARTLGAGRASRPSPRRSAWRRRGGDRERGDGGGPLAGRPHGAARDPLRRRHLAGPSPFVDPPVVRARFESYAAERG